MKPTTLLLATLLVTPACVLTDRPAPGIANFSIANDTDTAAYGTVEIQAHGVFDPGATKAFPVRVKHGLTEDVEVFADWSVYEKIERPGMDDGEGIGDAGIGIRHRFWEGYQGTSAGLEGRVSIPTGDTDELTVQTAGDPAEALYPYDNAYFTGGFYDYYDNWYGPRLVFGQGAEIDYAYDADVVYHELGHFIVRSRGGPKNSGANGYGLRVEGGALNEGLADYFSSAILGEGVLAEYAGGTEREYIRTLEGDATCATHIFGQVHYDSQPFAQGLWAFRQSLTPDDARALDEIVIDSLTAIGERTSFDTAYDVLTAAVDDRLGTAAGDDLRAEWDQRGVDACVPLQQVAVNTEEPARRFSQLPYFSEYSYASPVPGYLQFVIDVPEAGSTVTVRGSQLEFLGIDPYGVNVPNELLLLGGPGERIHWDDEVITTTQTYNGYKFTVDQIQWTHDVAELGTFAEVGTRPHSTQPDRYLVHDYALTFTVDDAGPFVFQFAHDHHGQAPVVYEVFVDLAPPPEAPDTGDTGDTPPTDTVPVTDTGDPSSSPTTPSGSGAASDDEEKGGCGCSGGASAPAGWLWLGALAAVLRRRRHGQAA